MISDQTISRSPNAVSRTLAGEEGAVILDVETTAYFRLNPVGCLVWERLEEPASLRQLVEHVRANVEDPPPDLLAEVEEFVAQLQSRDLVSLQ
jgi:hypothetical protein